MKKHWKKFAIALFLLVAVSVVSAVINELTEDKNPWDIDDQSLIDDEMVFVPAGVFIMGNDQGNPDESPVLKVYLDAYYIDKYEVTTRRYRKFAEATHGKIEGNRDDNRLNGATQPVQAISWLQCRALCKWEDKKIPTEAQWEKAARGTDGRLFPWGNATDMTKFSGVGDQDGFPYTAPVGSFPQGQSPYGAMDMSGNVKEFVADWYKADYYSESPEKNPTGPKTKFPPQNDEPKVARGGSWKNDTLNVRSTLRNEVTIGTANDYFGCRCAKDAKESGEAEGEKAVAN